MKRLLALALVASASLAHAQTAPTTTPAPSSPAKKELIAKIISLQQPSVDSLARSIVERPAMQMMQGAGQALQTQVPPEKREAVGKAIEADIKKFVEESTPIMKDRAAKVGPATMAPILEEKFNEDELKQLAAWLESPVNKKYQQVAPDLQQALVQKLVAEAGPALDPKLKALDQRIRTALGVPITPTSAASGSSGKAASSAKKSSTK